MQSIKIQIATTILFFIQFIGLNQYSIAQQLPQDALDSGEVVPSYSPSFLPTYTPDDRYGDPFSNTQSPSPLLLDDPSNLKLELEIDTGMNYTIYERIGALNYRPRSTMTFEEFQRYQDAKMTKEYWQNRSAGVDGESAVSGRRLVPKIYISPVFDRIFGGSYVDLEPTGFVNLDLGGNWQNVKNPAVPVNQQRNGGFNFDMQTSMNLVGKVGEKLAVTANFDNNNSFDFQNNMKVEYTGFEEDIIKKIEVGNVSMPVANSLITGGQSLFGVKTQLQFGKLYVTALASRQQGSAKSKTFTNGSEGTPFDLRASDYDQYRHFFLGHFFRDNYENSLKDIPQFNTSVQIIRLEVYVVKSQNETTGLRGIVAFTDLGESEKISNTGVISKNLVSDVNDNGANNLYESIKLDEGSLRNIALVSDYLDGNNGMTLVEGVDYEARPSVQKLDASEYKWDSKLGYVTLRNRLREGEVLAVSYEYTYNGSRYQVGEMSDTYQGFQDDELVIMKLLLPADNTDMDAPIWDLGMKNIYSLGGSRISSEGFELKVNYRDDINNYDAPYLNEGQNTTSVPLVELLKIDQLNVNGDNQPDANFDFIDGVTFDTDYGNVIFPVLEPFGSNLEAQFADDEQTLKDKYVYDELYTRTKTLAEQVSAKNKFRLTGSYSSGASGVYSLDGFNISEGSVRVSAGGTPLVENQQYTVNYQGAGQVNITDQGILSSGKTITISYEVDDLFSFESKWLTGTRLDYQFSENFNLGATLLHLKERTGGINRYDIGNEPINNAKYGFDVNYQEDSRIITKILDALPLLSTKETSTVNFSGEFAQLVPGTSAEVNGESASYIDDFENATTNYSLAGGSSGWMLGSTPDGFDMTAEVGSDLGAGFKRAKLAWYTIDNSFYTQNFVSGPAADGLENSFVRGIAQDEIFKGKELNNLDYAPMNIFDLAYYPRERGPYNFNNTDEGLDENGFLKSPEENFASITRGVPTNIDFTTNNVEYIEFWLMDPFNGDAVLDGSPNPVAPDRNNLEGKLTIHLGEVSEDVLVDNVQSFENGLPKDGGVDNTQETAWGKVSTQTFLTQYFEDTDSRDNQDVGLDGLSSGQEEVFSGYEDFRAHVTDNLNIGGVALGELEEDWSADNFVHYLEFGDEVQVLERYKNYNGYEGNSAISTSSTTTSATNIPESEDANDDRDMNTTESYFEYEVPINPAELEVGQGHVVDQVLDNNQVNWYLMRIPIKQPDASYGTPSFQYLRFIRMHMTGWTSAVVLRMAKFQMVGSQWRTYEDNLAEAGFGELPETAASDVEISVVNIEEHGSDANGKIPYVLPPGISRDIDNSTATSTQINEQSLKICVEDLEDGDARAAYKTGLGLDMINYGTLKMFFHGESNNGESIETGDVNVFIRFGLDQVSNYYEIELPLEITPDGLGVGGYSQDDVWPDANILELALDELYVLKATRNGEDYDVNSRFSRNSSNDDYTLTIVGNPKLSGITDMMIGVRNPSTGDDDDGSPKSVCFWANELRVTDFDSQKGWSANAQMNLKLADFATVNASINHTTVGFGGIQQTISQRTRSETTSYDISATVNIDKLIPVETGIKLPMFVSTSQSKETPQYDPLDDDIPLELSLEKFDSQQERDDYREKVITKVSEKSINFINVRKEKVNPESKSHIYDVENFGFSYSYSERKSSNVNTAYDNQKRYSGSVNYNYSVPAISVEPFKNASMSSPYLKLIKDLNFSPLPNNISVRGSVDRSFQKTQLRNSDLTIDGVTPNFVKYFTFDRSYNLKWNLFKGLSMSYTANVKAIIDEPEGDIDTEVKRDSVLTNLKNFGRTKNFDQNISLNYRLPLDKLPLTDWISADYRYQVQYTWVGGNIDQVETFGNVASNTRNRDVNAKVDFVKLYNKSKFLSNINKPPARSRSSRYDTIPTSAGAGMFKGILRMMMSVRSFSATYGLKESTTLPGLKPSPYALGMDKNFSSPGWQFLAGSQDPDIRYLASDEGWLVVNSEFSNNFIQSRSEDINLRASIEPFKDFKIQVDAKRSNSAGYSELYKYNDAFQDHESQTPTRTGSYSLTFLPIQTAFRNNGDNISDVFEEFVANRSVIQRRQNDKYLGGTVQEYSINSQDVLLPAFIAAYRGVSANNVSLNPLPKIPFPNWRVDYGGLGKLSALKDIFSSVNITHAYSSSFSVSNYTNSGLYSDENVLDLSNDILDYPLATADGEDGFLVPVYLIGDVDVIERFSPLLGISIRTKSMLSGKLEYSRERSLRFDLYNTQITEQKSDNMSFDIGLTKDKMKVPFKVKGRSVVLDNQVEFRLTLTIRDTKTIQRKIEDVNTTTEGTLSYQYRPTLSYAVNEKLNITMYYDRSINEPKVSSSFEIINSSFGVQIRFSLAQ